MIVGSLAGGVVASAITIPGMYAVAAAGSAVAGLIVARAVLGRQ